MTGHKRDIGNGTVKRVLAQSEEKKAKMAIPTEAPPDIELDEHGNVIPVEQRTNEDKEKARAGRSGKRVTVL